MPTDTAESTTSTEQDTTDYHWVMSVQTADGRTNTRDAVVTVPAGYTRNKLFQYVIKQFIEEYGTPILVVFWDAQPNQL